MEVAAIPPILAEASGWIDTDNADKAVTTERYVIVKLWKGNQFDEVIGYLNVNYIP